MAFALLDENQATIDHTSPTEVEIWTETGVGVIAGLIDLASLGSGNTVEVRVRCDPDGSDPDRTVFYSEQIAPLGPAPVVLIPPIPYGRKAIVTLIQTAGTTDAFVAWQLFSVV